MSSSNGQFSQPTLSKYFTVNGQTNTEEYIIRKRTLENVDDQDLPSRKRRDITKDKEIQNTENGHNDCSTQANGLSKANRKEIFHYQPLNERPKVTNAKGANHEKWIQNVAGVQIPSLEPSKESQNESSQDEDEPNMTNASNAKKFPSRKLTPLEQQFVGLKNEYGKETILVIEVGYKFRFLGEDAQTASKVLQIYCRPGKLKIENDALEARYSRFANASFPVARLMVHVKR